MKRSIMEFSTTFIEIKIKKRTERRNRPDRVPHSDRSCSPSHEYFVFCRTFPDPTRKTCCQGISEILFTEIEVTCNSFAVYK